MSGKASQKWHKKKAETFKKKHPEGRKIWSLTRKINKFINKQFDSKTIKEMESRLKRLKHE